MPTRIVVVVTRFLPKDGGMAEDHGVPETGKLPSVGPEVVEGQRVATE